MITSNLQRLSEFAIVRWWDRSGNLLLWRKEKLDREQEEKAQIQQQALMAAQRYDQLAAQLRALEIEPEQI